MSYNCSFPLPREARHSLWFKTPTSSFWIVVTCTWLLAPILLIHYKSRCPQSQLNLRASTQSLISWQRVFLAFKLLGAGQNRRHTVNQLSVNSHRVVSLTRIFRVSPNRLFICLSFDTYTNLIKLGKLQTAQVIQPTKSSTAPANNLECDKR